MIDQDRCWRETCAAPSNRLTSKTSVSQKFLCLFLTRKRGRTRHESLYCDCRTIGVSSVKRDSCSAPTDGHANASDANDFEEAREDPRALFPRAVVPKIQPPENVINFSGLNRFLSRRFFPPSSSSCSTHRG